MTAEEQGLLGSEYYAENPLYPLKNTLADINMDGLNTWGKTKDMTIIGLGNSTLDDTATEVLKDARPHRRPAIPNRKRDSSIAPIISSSPNRACPRSIPIRAPNYIGKPAGLRQAEARLLHGATIITSRPTK